MKMKEEFENRRNEKRENFAIKKRVNAKIILEDSTRKLKEILWSNQRSNGIRKQKGKIYIIKQRNETE